MAGNRCGISASQLARDYGVSLNDFVDEVIALLALTEADDVRSLSVPRCREICAAVSATMAAALDASTLSAEEREKLNPLITEVMTPFWQKHCEADPEASALIAARTPHYLTGRVAGSQVKTAANIVAALLEALEVPEERRPELARTLSPSFAHRIVGDRYRINELRAKHGLVS
jgi:hypothetical protein